MFKTTVTYEDFAGELTKEDLFFHLSVTEFMDLNLSGTDEENEDYLKRIVSENNKKEMFKTFEKLILSSYGEKSEDNKRFIKDDKKTKDFKSSEAFSSLILMIATDENIQEQFLSGIIPKVPKKETKREATKEISNNSSNIPEYYSKDDVDRLVKEELARINRSSDVKIKDNDTGSI